MGARHHRSVRLESNKLQCIDRLSGSAERAVLRWRLRPGDWQFEGGCLSDGDITVTIESDEDLRLSLREGWESLFYLGRSPLPVLEVELPVPTEVRTVIEFA